MSSKRSGLALLLAAILALGGRAFASSTATITVNGSEQFADANAITVSFNGFVETVHYGQYSTPASVASALGAMFSRDYLQAGLCAHASGNIITFKLRGAASFEALDVTGSMTSFQLQGSGFVTQVSGTVDTGTVALAVSGVVVATTNYGDGATPSSIAEGLAAGTTSGSRVNVTAVNDAVYLQAKQTGAGTNYTYAIQTTSWDSTDFPQPSFVPGGVSGSLSGGANAAIGQGQQTIYSYSIPSYVSGSQPTGYDADGNVVGYTDLVMGAWSFGYDTLNRLQSSSVTSGAYTGLQTSWGYDPFGNRTSETFSGSSSVLLPTSSSASYNANNQISGTSLRNGTALQYDASGDVTADNQNQYLYDGDGRMCAVRSLLTGTMTGYVFGPQGTRVSTGTISTWGSCDPALNGYQATKDSISGPSGGQLTEVGVDASGNVAWAHTNVWVGGQLLATYDPNGLHFHLSDWVGSRRVQTDYEGVVEQTCANLPYGDGVTCGANPTEELFAGLERDSESGLDHAMNRQYSSTFGRWTTPDPYGGSYNWGNPQSLNRYAYVNGRPLGATDTNGLDPIDIYLYYNGASFANLGDSELLDALLGYAAPLAFGLDIFEFGKDLGWWDTGPQFHGNVAASQASKTVPNTPQQDGFAGCGCLAEGLFHGAGQPYWGGANTLVNDAGLVYFGAVGVAATGGTLVGATTGFTFAEAGITTLGLESPSTTALLEAHVDAAVEEAYAQGLTRAQQAVADNNPSAEARFMGSNIHSIAADMVSNDPLLGNINVTRLFESGPDFFSSQTGQWWDITTPGQWLGHVAKYASAFGEGTFLGY